MSYDPKSMAPGTLNRYRGEKGLEHLREALFVHPLCARNHGLVNDLAEAMEIIELSLDDVLIGNGRSERDLFVILAGRLEVVTDGEEAVTRAAGEYVGEMALIDTEAKRCATVVAKDWSVVGKVDEPSFTKVADRHPVLWRKLAIDMVRRLQPGE